MQPSSSSDFPSGGQSVVVGARPREQQASRCGGATPAEPDAVRLAFGERPDGSIVHISQVSSGLACDCRCCGCASRLVARKGEVNEHHFAHHASAPCAAGYESALHKLAKQVLNERLELLLPEIAAGDDADRVVASPEGRFRFDQAEIEVAFEGFKPDVVLHRGERRLLVEVLVTHASEPDKIERIAAAGLSAVEIDLSGLPRGADTALVADAICGSAPRWWLANPRFERARLDWEARREAREQREAAVRERKRQQEEQRVGRIAEQVRAALAVPRRARAETAASRQVRTAGLATSIGRSVPGDECFAVAPEDWQAAVLADVVLSQVGIDSWHQHGRHPSEIFKAAGLSALLKQGMPGFIEPDLASTLRATIGFSTPYEVLRAYLSSLAESGLIIEQRKRWFVTDAARSRVGDTLEAQERRRTRRAQLVATVEHIVRSLPAGEQRGFHLENWLTRAPGRGELSPVDAIKRDDEGAALLAAATRLKLMLLAGGALSEDTLGLPIASACARERAAGERRAAEERRAEETRAAAAAAEAARLTALEARARADDLRARASQGMGGDADAWLETAVAPDEQAPAALAASGDAGYWQARNLLTAAVSERERQARTERLRDALRAQARQSARPDHGHVFLHSGQPRLRGTRPIDYCVDDGTYALVASMLRDVSKR